MSEFELSPEDDRFLIDVARHVRNNPHLYQEAGQWLDREYSPEECRKRELKRAERERKYLPPGVGKPLAKRHTDSELFRISSALKDVVESDKEAGVRVRTWEESAQVLLLCWLLTDPDAHQFRPILCELQQWPWDAPYTKKDGFSRLFARYVDWESWLDLCRRAWAARPSGKDGCPTTTPGGSEIDGGAEDLATIPKPVKPDGATERPNFLWWDKKRHELPPRSWQLLNYVLSCDGSAVPADDVFDRVYNGETDNESTLRADISKLNTVLMRISGEASTKLKLAYKQGHVTKS
jgi:hypothetical protein